MSGALSPEAALRLRRYSCYYLTRNSLTYTAPVMVSDAALKMDITQARCHAGATGETGDMHGLSEKLLLESGCWGSADNDIQ